MPIPIYVASRASVPARPTMWKEYRARGANIISTWIDEAGAEETEDFSELWFRITCEIRSAARLVLYAEPQDFPLKGALVEVGIAIGMSKPVWVIGKGMERMAKIPFGSWVRHPLVDVFLLNSTPEDMERALGLRGA